MLHALKYPRGASSHAAHKASWADEAIPKEARGRLASYVEPERLRTRWVHVGKDMTSKATSTYTQYDKEELIIDIYILSSLTEFAFKNISIIV